MISKRDEVGKMNFSGIQTLKKIDLETKNILTFADK